MDYFFGIDGGGTSSRLRIEARDGSLAFYGEAGGTNPNARSWDEIEATLAGLFTRARTESGIGPSDFVSGFVGSAGIDRPDDHGPFEAHLRRASGVTCPLAVSNDAEPALAGALEDSEGILLIAGTGAIAYGRSRDGHSLRAGGWGHLLGDEGSAWRIAFDAICRSIKSSEGRDFPTDLLEAALEHFGLPDMTALIPFVYGGYEKSSIARFARVVGAHRDRGDPLAIDLFTTAANELAGLVESVYRRIEASLERKRVAFRGGLIESDAWLRFELTARLARDLPLLEIVPATSDAARGACILARAIAGTA